ncbi:23S ribosomal RNA methyltransferase Erm [Olivibacter sp. SDN3]|uniref:23S ribosomal RNA methyltransferase Erm n=1 Tax=Olivibacter sp. SDN3 TaxID=2764720 RepID=UPI0016510034|nr:23S ribosomal RNA methyltransferase Erm [Olivibacter sp. SDN3]QNL48744.1 23S ribosomal RNA methyltransferase Erm [Olivibacter sp. SDN3]
MQRYRRPVRFTGQHFTIDNVLIADAINLVNLKQDDTVLDIGAGKGFITTHLTKHCDKVYAVENDPTLAKLLKQRFHDNKSVEIISLDFRDFVAPKTSFKVVANIPYCLTSALLKYLMYVNMEYFTSASLIMQFEPAQKLTMKSGTDPYKWFYRTFYDFQILYDIGPDSFFPPPKVKSALLRITKKKNWNIGVEMKEKYLSYLFFMFRKPNSNVSTILKTIFRKNQARHVIQKLHIRENIKVAELSAEKIAGCFDQMLLKVPDRFHP